MASERLVGTARQFARPWVLDVLLVRQATVGAPFGRESPHVVTAAVVAVVGQVTGGRPSDFVTVETQGCDDFGHGIPCRRGTENGMGGYSPWTSFFAQSRQQYFVNLLRGYSPTIQPSSVDVMGVPFILGPPQMSHDSMGCLRPSWADKEGECDRYPS